MGDQSLYAVHSTVPVLLMMHFCITCHSKVKLLNVNIMVMADIKVQVLEVLLLYKSLNCVSHNSYKTQISRFKRPTSKVAGLY